MTKFVLCSGGIGDALLGVAESYRLAPSPEKRPLLIHGANRFNRENIEEFLKPFGIPLLVLDGSFMEALKPAYATLSKHPDCLSTCHLPDDMNFTEWYNRPKYEPRVPRELPVQELFGKVERDRPLIGIVPAGSNLPPKIGTPFGEFTKNRILSAKETTALARRFTKDHTVVLFGSHEHEQLVSKVNDPNCIYATSQYLLDRAGNRTPNTIQRLYAMLNSCEHVYSMDTWAKTYSCYAKVPTTVIRTRYNGGYSDQQLDLSENIFLNQSIWDLNIKTIEELNAK